MLSGLGRPPRLDGPKHRHPRSAVPIEVYRMSWLSGSARYFPTRSRERILWPAVGLAFALAAAHPARAADAFKWGNITMGGGGFVSGLVASKTEMNVIYARTDVGGA